MKKIINFSEVNPISKKENKTIKSEINKIINKKNFILGSEVLTFEKNFAKLSKVKFAVGCGSGTDALILSLMCLNLKKNDEVIVPGMTYISTGLSVILNNNKLILADIDPETGLISIDKLKEKITKKTKVIIPVNLYGQKVDLNKLKKIAGKNIKIIEDSAQSHFAFSNSDKKQKNIALTSCYSFYPAKNLGAYGDGGLVTTNSRSIYNKLLALRNLGSIKKYKHTLLGMNSRLDTIQAVILNYKLKSILELNNKRRKIGKYYDKELCKINDIKLTKTDNGSSRHLYVIRTKKRDKLLKHLSSKNINCIMHYPYSLNNLQAFKNKVKKVNLRNAEEWARECISLPMHPNISIIEVKKVVQEVKNFFINK